MPPYNSYYILLEAKPKCIWTKYTNNKATNILLIFRFFIYIWFIGRENLCFILIFKEKNDKVLTFNIADFPKFEISASLSLAPPSNNRLTSQFQNLISAGGAY